jgi:SPP1 gp7 family putative phage head morphogenesis protein
MTIEELQKLTGRKSPKKLRPVKEPRMIELEYYRGLKKYANFMKRYVRENLMKELKNLQPQYTQDGYADDLNSIFNRMRTALISSVPVGLSAQMINGVNNKNRGRYASLLKSSFGVDIEGVLETKGLTEFTQAQIAKNATLIKSIPEEFIKNIETIVYNGVTSGDDYATIAKQISGIKDVSSVFGKLDNRVKMIARNEVSTINSQINQKRLQQLGLDLYIWRTSSDERVRGNPSGKYPKARPRHDTMDGKVCRWDDPTVYADSIKQAREGKWKKRSSINGPEQHPGEPILCRCIAEPIVE